MIQRSANALSAQLIQAPEQHQVELPCSRVTEHLLELRPAWVAACFMIHVLACDFSALLPAVLTKSDRLVLGVLAPVLRCVWGCVMPVEIIVDHWNPEKRRYRTETFCYGPLSCPVYKSGPTRKVLGRNGMVHEEPDWLDQEATAHRSLNE